VSDFAALLTDLEAIESTPRLKRQIRAVLWRYAGRVLYVNQSAILARERQDLLLTLARAGYPRSDLVRMLAERQGVSLRSAQRWVSCL
jgi:hypothetical protein